MVITLLIVLGLVSGALLAQPQLAPDLLGYAPRGVRRMGRCVLPFCPCILLHHPRFRPSARLLRVCWVSRWQGVCFYVNMMIDSGRGAIPGFGSTRVRAERSSPFERSSIMRAHRSSYDDEDEEVRQVDPGLVNALHDVERLEESLRSKKAQPAARH